MDQTLVDIPCHGARFDADGRVLHTPADRDPEHLDISQDAERIAAEEHL